MKSKLGICMIALTLSSGAWAQTTGSTTTPATTAAPTGVGGSGAFSGWLSDYQSKNKGMVSRQAYMDEVGRRWDAADKNKQGLTTDQINQMYGSGSGSGMGSGSMGATGAAGVNSAPGNMGPNNVKK